MSEGTVRKWCRMFKDGRADNRPVYACQARVEKLKKMQQEQTQVSKKHEKHIL
jgi:hypothetical protein